MRPIALPLIAVAALAAQPALAELHKCTTKEGKTIYTEFECEGDANAILGTAVLGITMTFTTTATPDIGAN